MIWENLIFETQDNIAIITFNRPRALNALNSDLFAELSVALDKIEKSGRLRVLILTGAGDKSFIAGADIKELAGFSTLQAKAFSKKGQDIMDKLQELPIPVIAMVNGYALGGGSEIALACDFIYASENARFGQPEINLGLIPGFGGTQRLPRLIGKNIAKEMIFTGKIISADKAKKLGWVNEVFPLEDLMEETLKTAREIASKGGVSLHEAKQTINNGLNVDISTGCGIESSSFALCMADSDAKEGMNAFIEKRMAMFKGSRSE